MHLMSIAIMAILILGLGIWDVAVFAACLKLEKKEKEERVKRSGNVECGAFGSDFTERAPAVVQRCKCITGNQDNIDSASGMWSEGKGENEREGKVNVKRMEQWETGKIPHGRGG